MSVGAHVSAAGGLWNGPKNAGKIGCETFKFFSRPPQGGNVKAISEEDQKLFRDAMKEYKIKSCYIHGPYVINLASEKASTRANSVRLLREELERGSLLGVSGMMFHPGSAKEVGEEAGTKFVIASHLNDSKVELGSHKDRHEHIGKGLIGKDAIKLFVQHPKLHHLDLLLETPLDEEQAGEVKLLKKWRNV